MDNLLKTKKERTNSKKHEIHDIFIKTNEDKFAFNTAWLIKHLILLKSKICWISGTYKSRDTPLEFY